MFFDLGSAGSYSRLNYSYCSTAGFSNGGVKDFALYVGDTIDGPWTLAVDGAIPEDVNQDLRGSKLEFDFPREARSQFWKWSGIEQLRK